MTPEQTQKFNELVAFMENLKASYSIPIEVDRAFRERLFGNIMGTYPTQVVGGNTVPAQPSGTLKININGKTYELVLK